MTEPDRVRIVARLYSGRRNPMWEGRAADIAARLDMLPRVPCPPRSPLRLGYRGLTLIFTGSDSAEMRFDIANGVVRSGQICRGDTGRRVERDLLTLGADTLGAERLARILPDLR